MRELSTVYDDPAVTAEFRRAGFETVPFDLAQAAGSRVLGLATAEDVMTNVAASVEATAAELLVGPKHTFGRFAGGQVVERSVLVDLDSVDQGQPVLPDVAFTKSTWQQPISVRV